MPNLSTGIISTSYYSDISKDIDMGKDCEDEGNERQAMFANETTIATIYPNPSNGNIILSTQFKKDQLVNINIYNSSGQKIIDQIQKHVTNRNEYTFKLNLENYPNGIYFLQLQWPNGYKSLKIIKHY